MNPMHGARLPVLHTPMAMHQVTGDLQQYLHDTQMARIVWNEHWEKAVCLVAGVSSVPLRDGACASQGLHQHLLPAGDGHRHPGCQLSELW